MAASLLLVVTAGYWLHFPSENTDAEGMVAPFVAQTLESAPSGTRVAHPEAELVVMPLATYKTETGQFCRTYAGRIQEARLSGLACRNASGDWATVVQQTLNPTPTNTSAETYRPASGASDVVTPALDKLGAEAPLPSLRESDLLQNNWR